MNLIQISNKAAKVKIDDTIDSWSRKQLLDEIGKTYGAAKAESGDTFGGLTNCASNAIDTLDVVSIRAPCERGDQSFCVHSWSGVSFNPRPL